MTNAQKIRRSISFTAQICRMFPAYPWTDEDERTAEIERERVRKLESKLREEEE